MARPSPRLDPAPLLRLFPDATARDIASALGVSPGLVRKWRMGVGVTVVLADRIGVQLRGHPALVWPEWYDLEVIEPEMTAEGAAA